MGDNNLDTCLQFDLVDSEEGTIAKVKMYDKITDLVCRESQKLVGSRFREVVGSRLQPGEMAAKLRKAQNVGITRLEVSIYFS